MSIDIMNKYTTRCYDAVVPVEKYIEECVDVPEFLEYCRQCPSASFFN